jgi:cyclohexyl-isocyanide hydratase
LPLEAVLSFPDRVTGTRIALCAFEGMTLLDLVGPLDALSRIATMRFDETTTCEVIGLTRPHDDLTVTDVVAWQGFGAGLVARRYRPALDQFDTLIIPGGLGIDELLRDEAIRSYLSSYPPNRLLASVCSGSLLIGALGRLKHLRATTHASRMHQLADFGATAVRERVVEQGNIITGGGVSAGIDLGLHIVRRLMGDGVATAIAEQMEVRR